MPLSQSRQTEASIRPFNKQPPNCIRLFRVAHGREPPPLSDMTSNEELQRAVTRRCRDAASARLDHPLVSCFTWQRAAAEQRVMSGRRSVPTDD
jgi:hypothetical protein